MVLLGGFVGSGDTTWRHQIEALSRSHTVLVWDAPGLGGSPDVPASFRLPDYADRLAELLSWSELEPAVLVGLSFGGAVALELFRRHRGLVRALFLAGVSPGWSGSLPAEVVQTRWETSLEASRQTPAAFVSALLPSMFSARADPDRVAEFGASMAASFHPAGFRTLVRALAEADLRDLLPSVDVPTVVLHGEADARTPRTVADAVHAAIPGSRLVVLPGVGHVSPVEAPERVTAEVQAFLGR